MHPTITYSDRLDKIGLKRCEICSEGVVKKGQLCTQWQDCINTPHVTGRMYIQKGVNLDNDHVGIGISEIEK